MEIAYIEQHSIAQLIENIQSVGLLTRPDILVYKDSLIELATFHTDEIAPAQRYVLTYELKKVQELRWSLLEHNIDLFCLNGYITIWLDGYDDPIDVIPPVIEQSAEADGSVANILNDGMHRVYLARMEHVPVQTVYIRNVPQQYPYYAYPLARRWDDVEMIQSLPDGYIKKWYRTKDYKSLYRNFNMGFNNVGKPREHCANAK